MGFRQHGIGTAARGDLDEEHPTLPFQDDASHAAGIAGCAKLFKGHALHGLLLVSNCYQQELCVFY